MKKTSIIKISYEPITLTKTLLQMYAEKFIEGQVVKPVQFAVYEYLRVQTDEECEDLLNEYAAQENLQVITFEDWEKDCKKMFNIIQEEQKFKDILSKFTSSKEVNN